MDLNHDWFIPYLLFERIVIVQLFADSVKSGNDDDDNDDSESNEGVSGAEESEYRNDKELL